jgi:hypothetical protein
MALNRPFHEFWHFPAPFIFKQANHARGTLWLIHSPKKRLDARNLQKRRRARAANALFSSRSAMSGNDRPPFRRAE